LIPLERRVIFYISQRKVALQDGQVLNSSFPHAFLFTNIKIRNSTHTWYTHLYMEIMRAVMLHNLTCRIGSVILSFRHFHSSNFLRIVSKSWFSLAMQSMLPVTRNLGSVNAATLKKITNALFTRSPRKAVAQLLKLIACMAKIWNWSS